MTDASRFFMNCVVAIGADVPGQNRPRWVATGFLYGRISRNCPAENSEHDVYLITNRHVFQRMLEKDLRDIWLRFSTSAKETVGEYRVPLVRRHGGVDVPRHSVNMDSDADIAVLPVDFVSFRQHYKEVGYFESTEDAANIRRLNELGLREGDPLYVVGFPTELPFKHRHTPIVRKGSAAFVADALLGVDNAFILDVHIFRGESGSPVIWRPQPCGTAGTRGGRQAYLIGIMSDYYPMRERAVLERDGQDTETDLIFRENSGLARAYPVDFIEHAIAAKL